MPKQMIHDETDELSMIRDELSILVKDVLDTLTSSNEDIELPVSVEFSDDLVIQQQKGRDIAKTVKRGIVEKQLLIAVNQSTRPNPIEVGYIQPPNEKGKFISAIVSPDYKEILTDPESAIKDAIIQLHTLDLVSTAMGVKLISHGIEVDRMVYSVNLGN